MVIPGVQSLSPDSTEPLSGTSAQSQDPHDLVPAATTIVATDTLPCPFGDVEIDSGQESPSQEDRSTFEEQWRNMEPLSMIPMARRDEVAAILEIDPNKRQVLRLCKSGIWDALGAIEKLGMPRLVTHELLLMRIDEYQCHSCIQFHIQDNRHYCNESNGLMDTVDFYCSKFQVTSGGKK